MKTATLDNPARPANAVTRPALKWRIISTLLSTVGRLSAGIDIGYRHGFDSGIMLDRVYENRASGRYLVGRVIDRFYLDTLGWRAIRARRQLLKRILHDEIDRALDRPERRVVLLDVASGPGRYLLELCQEMKASDSALDLSERLSVICRDLSLPALEQGR